MIILALKKFKTAVAASVLISVFAVAGFGFAAMNHDGSHMEPGCLASVIDNSVCPKDAHAMAAHHASLYNELVMSPGYPVYLLLLAVFAVFMLFVLQYRLLLPRRAVAIRHNDSDALLLRIPSEVNYWLSLLEHSPSR